MIRSFTKWFMHLVLALVMIEGMGAVSLACVDCAEHDPVEHHDDSGTCDHSSHASSTESDSHGCACHCHAPTGLADVSVAVMSKVLCVGRVPEPHRAAPNAALTDIDHPPLSV